MAWSLEEVKELAEKRSVYEAIPYPLALAIEVAIVSAPGQRSYLSGWPLLTRTDTGTPGYIVDTVWWHDAGYSINLEVPMTRHGAYIDGSDVYKANFNTFKTLFPEVTVERTHAHSTFLVIENATENFTEQMAAKILELQSYPLLDDMEVGKVQSEMLAESWANYGRRDWQEAIGKAIALQFPGLATLIDPLGLASRFVAFVEASAGILLRHEDFGDFEEDSVVEKMDYVFAVLNPEDEDDREKFFELPAVKEWFSFVN